MILGNRTLMQHANSAAPGQEPGGPAICKLRSASRHDTIKAYQTVSNKHFILPGRPYQSKHLTELGDLPEGHSSSPWLQPSPAANFRSSVHTGRIIIGQDTCAKQLSGLYLPTNGMFCCLWHREIISSHAMLAPAKSRPSQSR